MRKTVLFENLQNEICGDYMIWNTPETMHGKNKTLWLTRRVLLYNNKHCIRIILI
jgi:hypothetical protein